jgi:hypothetical protein
MIRHPVRIACTALLVVVAACSASRQATPASGNRNVLSFEEMQQSGYPDAFTTVQSLRPQWLVKRGATSARSQTIKVYLDGSLFGGPESLRQVTTRSISYMQYLTGLQASERYGLDHDMGAIIVTTRRE